MPDQPDFSAAIQAVDPARVFLTTTENAEIRYGDLDSISRQFAAEVRALGIAADEPVAILLPQGPEAIVAILATMSAAVAAPLNPALGTPELRTLLQKIRPRIVIADESLDQTLLSAVRAQGIPLLVLSKYPELRLMATGESQSAATRIADAPPENAAGLLLPTSGTTGEPKLVKLSHAQLLYAATQIAAVLELSAADRNFCVLPCFHIHGLSTVLATVLTGGVVIAGGVFRAESFEQTLVAQRATWLSATPAHFQALLTARKRSGVTPAPHSLRFLRSASAPICDSLATALEQAFRVPLIQAYGMTEAGPHIASNGLRAEQRRLGSVGRPTGTQVAIRHMDGSPARQGIVGEIAIRGANVIREYFRDASAQDASAQDGIVDDTSFCEEGFRTGDMGFLDPDGFLFVTGRLREVINSGGQKLSPRQIESVLLEHPAVRDAVVYPARHPTLGEVPHAAIVLHDGFIYPDSDPGSGAQLQQILRRYCMSQLAPFKVPHALHFVAQIPTGENGKVRRHTLHALLDVDAPGQHTAVGGGLPLQSLQRAVSAVWEDVLGPGDYRADDNFFQQGGDSLTATMAIQALERAVGVRLPTNCFFQHPTLSQQAELLARQSAAWALPSVSTGTLFIDQLAPLSAGQRRLWFLHRTGCGSEYNMGASLRLRGRLDAGSLNQAVNALCQRHAALRTTIGVLDGNPVQRIRPYVQADLAVVDICDLPRTQKGERALDLAGDFRNQSFDLEKGPLYRCQLVRIDSDEHLFSIGIHHIICDGWSMEILQRELFALYAQCVAGLPTDRLPPPVQFHEYVAWNLQSEGSATQRKQQQIVWWRQQLVDVDPILQLPGGSGQSGRASSRAGHFHFCIPAAEQKRLEECAMHSGATLYMLMVSALGILLHRFTRQQHFCLGTVSAGREHAGVEQVVGFLAKTLPLPIRVVATESVSAVVDRCVDTVRGVFAHADIEFEEIVQACRSARVEGVSPLFQVMFAFHNLPQQAMDGIRAVRAVDNLADDNAVGSPALVTERVAVATDRAKFDLSLHIRPGNDGLKGVWQYRRDNIDAQTIAGMNRDFSTILRVIVEAPASAVAEIPFAGDKFARRTDGDNDPPVAGEPLPVLQLIARQAADNPLGAAIRAKSGRLLYGDVLDRVGRLANCLGSMGIGPGKTVAILLPRDAAMIISPLAVMATGAAFVPLDCLSPVDRLREMIDVCRIDLLIVNSATKAKPFPEAGFASHPPRLLCLDESEQAIAGCSPDVHLPAPSPDDTAYIIFTSGSTGQPKGVAISHGNLAHYAQAMSRELKIDATDSYLHTASSAFSASIRQYVLPLACGAEVVIADRQQVENVEALLTVIRQQGVTILDLVPTLWRGCHRWLVVSGRLSGEFSCPRLRLLLSASEPLPGALAASICAVWPHAQLLNMYGQTETTGIVATYCVHSPDAAARVVALGKPIGGQAVQLLDEQARPVPTGAVGEICVSGSCVGQGYLTIDNRRLRAFVQPLDSDSDAPKIYRTGDLGRFRDDGNLEFHGRLDAQIKHRGFRIEPGEIESVALAHPQITAAAICIADGAAGRDTAELQMLYCAAEGADTAFLGVQLRAYLGQRLPSYMVPSQLFRVDTMPRTLSGKLDRGALRAHLPRNGAAGNLGTRTIEQQLQSIWREVLLRETVGLHDNFFDLGGNSILSIEIVSAAADAGLDLTLDQVFKHQTIAELATVVSTRAAVATATVVKPAAPLVRYTVESLRAFSHEALAAAGLPPEGAAIVTEVQLESSLRGQATHNIADIPRYAGRLASGVLNANPVISVVETSAISATVDGDNAPGQWVATVAMDRAIALASRSGAGIVGARRSNHFGAAGHYAWRASLAGLVGMCFTNGPVVIAPTGGVTPLFGNNPLAIGVPRRAGHPVVLDIAMSVATRGKIGLEVADGRPLQAGWILDKLGLPTTQLADLAAGLAAPIGGHKGSGLALAIEILAGALTGAGYCRDHGREASARHGGADIGHFFIAFDPQLFIGRYDFEARVEDIVMQAKSSELAAGNTEIVVPGEREFSAREENLRLGVPLQVADIRRLADFAERHGLGARLCPASPDWR